ncbi:SARP family transcriptional regulator [Paractinoplanes deccanensis]|uniref:SARP family transcriptional regulator n=2 Tax=Paractinoplanes deccanensis TaxID=113561 RepID=A0ABQ3XUV0_9ACTN|nr:SARP family transcriptional regulator [Actinoplanes deccanensis]
MLGPFDVAGAGGQVSAASQRTVLALLALHAGRPVGVAALVDALWPEGPPPSARNSLQSHVTRLRAVLGGAGVIRFDPAGYRLAVPRDAVDVLLFEDLLRDDASLGAALELWRGPALPEFDGEPFRGVAERLAGLRREALARLVSRESDPDLERLWAATVEEPCWERGALVLAGALARAGRRGEAIEALRRHADAVVDELGLDPSEAVRRLQISILRGEEAPAAPRVPDAAQRVPLRFSSFLGRDAELKELADLLRGPALVTVAGPGGVGKTRLVAETVRAGSRVAWIDAADVSEEDFLAAVAVGVGARLGPADDPIAAIGAAAREHSVVVLDNCEHVVEPAAAVVEAMRGTRVVVTSQERLRVDGERVLDLAPLDDAAAARLFAERAGVAADEDVEEIVRRLDRLPLAIELAAVQAAALGVRELRARLDDRLDLLVRGRRTADARHRTLRAVVEWSFGLLDDAGRVVMRRLSVFAGAFTVAQAEAVVADRTTAPVAASIAALVDRSLVVRHGPGRFRLLETVRAYAAEQLGDDRPATERRHATEMAAAARRLDRRLRGQDQAAAVREIDALLPELRLAFARGDRRTRAELAAAMYRYGYRCQQYEVLAWGHAAVESGMSDALAAAATHAWGRGNLAEAQALASRVEPLGAAAHEVLGDVALVQCDPETARRHYRAMDGEPVHRVSGLVGEALVAAWSGDVAAAEALATAALDLATSTGNPSARAEALYGLGEALGDTDPPRALDLLTEAAALAATVDDRLFRGAAETAAVAIRSRHGDPAAALASFREVLNLWRAVGNDTLQAAALRNLIVLLVRVGADETAVLVDAALPPAGLYPAEAARLDRARAAATERLGPERVAELRGRKAHVHDEASRAIDAALSRMAG